MSLPDPQKVPQVVLTALATSIERALSQACRLQWHATIQEGKGASLEKASATTLLLRFTGSWSGEASLAFPISDLAKLTFTEVEDTADTTRLNDALSDAISGMTNGMGKLLEEHGPITIRVEPGLADDKAAENTSELLLQAEGADTQIRVQVCCDSNLIASSQMSASKAFTFPEATPPANLDLVLDVALNVTLRFGQRQLALREVLDLTSGSVVELDRQVDEPVELVLDGRVIARGEAVIIDGSYGMRITQVLQPVIPEVRAH